MRTLIESPAGRLAESVAATGRDALGAAASAAAVGIPAFAELGLLGLEPATAS
jgi:hypothetical protein